MANHETTTRVYWSTEHNDNHGWEAQRNDGTTWGVMGDLDDDDDTIIDYAKAWCPCGLDAGTVSMDR